MFSFRFLTLKVPETFKVTEKNFLSHYPDFFFFFNFIFIHSLSDVSYPHLLLTTPLLAPWYDSAPFLILTSYFFNLFSGGGEGGYLI